MNFLHGPSFLLILFQQKKGKLFFNLFSEEKSVVFKVIMELTNYVGLEVSL